MACGSSRKAGTTSGGDWGRRVWYKSYIGQATTGLDGRCAAYIARSSRHVAGVAIREFYLMATYREIQNWVRTASGFVPKTSWIAHVKADRGLSGRRAANRFNHPTRVNPCPTTRSRRSRPPSAILGWCDEQCWATERRADDADQRWPVKRGLYNGADAQRSSGEGFVQLIPCRGSIQRIHHRGVSQHLAAESRSAMIL
jgi:hypothetical protein